MFYGTSRWPENVKEKTLRFICPSEANDSANPLPESNADQVKKIRQVLEGLSLDIATPDEARQMLSLKGVDQVAF